MEFREALRQLLGDVDRIGMRANYDKTIVPGRGFDWNAPYTLIEQLVHIENELIGIHFAQKSDILPNSKVWSAETMLAEMRRMNLPLQDYQEPSCFDYYLNYPSENSSRFPLGNILLFRRRGGSPISDQTLRTVESLERFFIFSFTSLKARYFYHHVGAAIFNWSVVGIKSELKLTNREFQVFIYRLYGLTFKQIAAELFISHATVRKHLQSLLRKGNARNAIEMFTRRFLQGAENVLAGGKDGLSEMAKPETEGEGDILLW